MKTKKCSFQYLLICILSGILLSACTASGVRFKGKSATFGGDNILRNDVFSVISKYERSFYNCSDITSVRSIIGSIKNVQGLTHVEELWVVEACGKQHQYPISLREDAKGETDFNVTILPRN